ncbi:hypothetical protein T492DRAFT_131429 [Pavlovales sp. CCMP2436]|nr:hypothetical protein T492DRAFT_131429 [Pavlovales sp. CCMP2436]
MCRARRLTSTRAALHPRASNVANGECAVNPTNACARAAPQGSRRGPRMMKLDRCASAAWKPTRVGSMRAARDRFVAPCSPSRPLHFWTTPPPPSSPTPLHIHTHTPPPPHIHHHHTDISALTSFRARRAWRAHPLSRTARPLSPPTLPHSPSLRTPQIFRCPYLLFFLPSQRALRVLERERATSCLSLPARLPVLPLGHAH